MRYGMLIDLNSCVGCASCVKACKAEHGTGEGVYWCNLNIKNVVDSQGVKLKTLPFACMHCQNAPCVNACPAEASYHTSEGIVLVDYEKCIGCRVCIDICPYQVRYFNYAPRTDESSESEIPSFGQVNSKKQPVGKTGKCNFCIERLREGRKPACVEACSNGYRIFGDLDDENSEISIAIRKNYARPLYEDLDTSPSIFYIGPF